MAQGPERVLEKTLQDLHIRSEVEATMQSMLVDVELAASLQRDLALQSQLSELKEQAVNDESALNEARAMQSQQKQHQVSLADSLVQELWALSRELGELQRWKQTHETTVLENDELLAKLLQAEEQIRELESRPPVSFVDDAAAFVDPTDFEVSPESSPVVKKEVPSVEETASIEKEVNELLSPQPDEMGVVEEEAPHSEPAEPDNAPPTETDGDAVVALLQEEEGDAPSLDMLDMTILTHIFEFLDALEILSTAQVNVTMYSRVDALFGLGAEAARAEASTPPAPVAKSTGQPPTKSSLSQPPDPPSSSSTAMTPAPATAVSGTSQ